MLISVVLPVYNQADHIEEAVGSHLEMLKSFAHPFEMILVVNGNRDGSVAVCEKLAQRFSSVRVVVPPRQGWGHAVKAGIAEAKGDIVCYTNSARTSPGDLALFLMYGVANPNTVIKANRKIRNQFIRRLGSLLYNLESRYLFDLPVWDINGTPKVFPRGFNGLFELQYDNDLIDLEFLVTCRRHNYPILEVPIASSRRFGGSSTTNFGTAARLLWGAIQMKRRLKEPSN